MQGSISEAHRAPDDRSRAEPSGSASEMAARTTSRETADRLGKRNKSLYIIVRHAILLGFLGGIVNAILFIGVILKMLGLESSSWRLGCWTANGLWGYIQDHLEESLGGKEVFTFSGDLEDVRPGEGAVVIANHQGYADYYLIHALAQRLPLSTPAPATPPESAPSTPSSDGTAQSDPFYRDVRIDDISPGRGMLGSCRYFAKKSLVWQVPVFGWSMWAIGMILISRDWTTDARLIKSTFWRIKENKHPCWIVSYLEGTRLSKRKLEQSVDFAKKAGKPTFERVLYPRTRGFVTTVQELRNSHIKYIYDLTLCYSAPQLPATPRPRTKGVKDAPKSYGTSESAAERDQNKKMDAVLRGPARAPSLAELLGTRDLGEAGYRFHVHMRRFEVASLPESEDELKEWVEGVWHKKDLFLQERARAAHT